jgi:methylenetetrahydrofolate dehydrogenase (NADP+) / methenyltetrahydrofolate cyclohydrolase
MKYLSGANLVDYISERQARQVRALIQSKNIQPKLVIISTNPKNKASKIYTELKVTRAQDLGITAEIIETTESKASELIQELSKDKSVHGIILQLPLKDAFKTEELLSLIPPEKDVDGLNPKSKVTPATAGAILWLLAGYNIDLKDKKILIIGQGRLVGLPLASALQEQGLSPQTADESTPRKELIQAIQNAEIIITATGYASLIKEEMLRDGQVIIGAGLSEDAKAEQLTGDLDPKVYQSKLNIKVTPQKGGVGPLTISYLFENLLQLIDKTT